jgi:hypothetical protein
MSESLQDSATALNRLYAAPSDLESLAARLQAASQSEASATAAAAERTLPFGFTIVPTSGGRTGSHAII